MRNFIVIDLVVSSISLETGLNSGVICVQAHGPSGRWNRAIPTEAEYLVNGIRKLSAWKDLVSQPAEGRTGELDHYSPLEGGFELALVATSDGFAVEAREDDRLGGLRRHTRVPVSADDVATFVDRLIEAVEGRAMGASLGDLNPSEEAGHAPLLRISSDGVCSLSEPGRCAGEGITDADVAFIRERLSDATQLLKVAGKWQDPPTDTMWSPSGAIGVACRVVTGGEMAEQRLDVTVSTPAEGPLWSLCMPITGLDATLNGGDEAVIELCGIPRSNIPL